MDISTSIIIGVISGLITSIVLSLIIELFTKVFKPWYQDMVYQGVRIDGIWSTQKTFKENQVIQNELIELKQHAYKISGIKTITKRFEQEDKIEIKTFKISGHICDRFVHISAKNTDDKKIGITNCLYEVCNGGGAMTGSTSWFDVGTNQIVNQIETLKRK